ncbi:MAG: hypothetical protein ACYDAK_02285 [Candidatus Limnocylindrales bacterium]
MARAKRTDRAEARRRYRAEAAEAAATEIPDDDEAAPAGAAGARPGSAAARSAATTGLTPRPGFLGAFRSAYHVADIRGDLRALPGLVRGRAFLVSSGLIVATLVVAIATTGVPNAITALVVALFLGPLPIGAIYAAGALAPRASYLLGAIASFLGTLGLVVYAVTVTRSVPSIADVVYAFVFYTVFGGVIGAGLGFYRRLLRALNPTPNRRPSQRPRNGAKAGAKAR